MGTIRFAMVMCLAAACGGGGGGGDDGGSANDALLMQCHAARDWKASLGCTVDPTDLCAVDVEWLELTAGACYDELLGWWECLETETECAGGCPTSPALDCTSAYCAANPSNEACTRCLQGCPPPPP